MSNYNTLKTADTINAISIVDGAITTSKLNASVTTLIVAGGGPKVTAITYPGNDLAADPAGGQTIALTGTGFVSGCSVFVGTTQASVVTVVSATSVTFTAPALAAATYTLYLVNPDGGTATIVPGISYSGTPIWSTTAGTLGSIYEYSPISNATTATGDGSISYSVFSGTLPTGSSLNTSTGVITGTSPASAGATTYTFVIRATDAQLQDSDRSFSITVNTDTVTWTTPADNSTTTLGKDAASSTTLLATSAAGNAITYTANTLPTGLSISGATVTGTPTVIASTTSTFTATAATTGRTATRTINWTVSVASDTYFPYTTLLLSGATATETFIADASTNNFVVTVTGDTKPNNFNPYTPGYYSNYFNGSSNFTSSTSQIVPTGSFTVECWVYVTSTANQAFVAQGTSANAARFSIAIDGGLWWTQIGNASINTGTPIINTWNYLAVTFNGSTLTLYVNGASIGTVATSTSAQNTTLTIGTLGSSWAAGYFVTGYISNVRVSSVVRTIITPTAPYTSDASTRLLTCQSNRFLDNSANAFALTITGTPSVQSSTPFVPNTAYAAYGSTYFDGNADSLTITTAQASLGLGTGDFTVECWAYRTAVANYQVIIKLNDYSNGLVVRTESPTYSDSFYYVNTGYNWNPTLNFPANTWTHICVTRQSGTLRLFVNGNIIVSATNTANMVLSPAEIGSNGYIGYISNIRVVKGTAVYATASTTIGATIFTPPTAPLTAVAGTSLLTLQTNQPASNSVFLDSSTNAFAVTGAGNTSAGTFTPYGANWSNYFDGTGQAFYNSSFTGANFGTSNFTIEMWVLWSASAASNQTVIEFTGTRRIIIGRSSTGIRYFNDGTERGYTVTVPVGTWNHIAIVRVANTTNIYLNGVSGTSFVDNVSWAETQFYVGRNSDGVESTSALYLSNLRVVNGTAVYTSNFAIPTAPLTAISGTTLLICKSNSFIDNSANAFGVTLIGTPSVQRFSPFSPQTQTAITNSVYYGTKTDYISTPATTPLTTFTGDFTFECWVNPTDTSISTNWGIWDSRQNGQTASAMIFTLQNLASPVTGQWRLSYYYGSGTQTYGTGIVLANQWTHVAFVRSGSTLTYYVNGVAGGTATVSGTQTGSATSNPVYIGTKDGSLGGYGTVGYISNFRIVKGVAVYTGNFTVPTSQLTATQSSGTNIAAITGTQTSLLTFQSSTLIDNSTNAYVLTPATTTIKPRTLNPFGFTNASAAYSAATYGGSAYFDGSGDYLDVPHSTNQWIGASIDFTIECWFNVTSSSGERVLIAKGYQGSPAYAEFGITINSSNILVGLVSSSGGSWLATPTDTVAISSNTWNHVAMVRSGTTITLYRNGVVAATSTGVGAALYNHTGPIRIGQHTSGSNFTGHISNARVVIGTAVYTSAFTPPTAPLTAITNTSLLLNMTTSGIYDAASMSNLETVADAKLVATHTPYAGSYYSNYFDGTGDVFTVPNNSGFNFSSDFIIEAWLYPTAFGQGGCNFITHWSGSSNVYVARVLNNARVQFLYTAGGTTLTGTSTTVSLNQWSHVAVCRSGSTIRIFVNGIADTTTATYSGTLSGGGLIAVGAHNDTSEGWTGYISNLRVVNTPSAPYTTTFTPSTTPLTSITGTALLTCQSNRFLDNSANAGTITKSGHVAVQSFNPFQRNSAATMSFDGTGDYLKAPYNPAYNFGTGDFTIECWLYQVVFTSDMVITASITTWASSVNFYFGTRAGSPNILIFRAGDSIPISLNGNTGLTTNTWTHVAASRAAGITRMFVNGVTQSATHTGSVNVGTTAQSIGIGAANNASEPINAYINDLRITKGVARYTSTFTPPTTAFITK